ncbi:MAG: membrane protein insertase YidC [Rhodospirillaceae bacterium]|nr:membrane protein insertase YidC [Rhodospirillaceae bacterium]
MDNQKNVLLAVVLSLIILVGWEMFFAPKPVPKPAADQVTAVAPVTPGSPVPVAPGTLPAVGASSPEAQATSVTVEGPRASINTPHIKGSLSLSGSRFDDVTLLKYRETIDPASPPIDLLSGMAATKPYFAELGWLSGDATLRLPGPTTVWTPRDGDAALTDTRPLVLTWDNGAGLRFTKTIRADKDYMFTVEQTVENYGEQAATIYPYGLVARVDTPVTQGFFILHEGPLGVFDRTLKEVKYKDLQKEPRMVVQSTGGWIGFTDKYWLTAVAFDQSLKIDATFNHSMVGGRDRYQTDLRGEPITLAAKDTKTITSYVFAGAKELALLDSYTDNLGIARLDLAVDFGWFYFLTKPFFYILTWLKGVLGNFGLAILGFTIFLRGLMFPLANKQFESMSKLKKLQPEMQKLQERFANDRARLNQEMMELYKKEKANPLAGCLPIVIQIPVFFALYKVLFVSIEMRHAPFYGWIHDLSAMDPTNVFTLFGLIPFTMPSFLHIGVWPLIMGITMWLQQKLNPQPADPIQAKVFMVFPFVFTYMLATFPAGLVIYWAWSNLLGIIQQTVIMRRMGVSRK